MTCTTYGDSVAYNAAIPYSGQCTTPGGGIGAISDVFYIPFPPLEGDEGVVITLLGLLEDDV